MLCVADSRPPTLRAPMPRRPASLCVFQITLQVDNKEWRARAGIPEEATHFAFVYPMEGTEKLTDALIWSVEKLEAAVEEGDAADDGPIPVPAQLELAYELLGTMTEGDWSFLCFGGYAYFDADENILQVNAIAQGDALHFNGPFPLTQDVLKKLDKGERLQPVTLSPIRSTGATRFCWIYPNELASFGIEVRRRSSAASGARDGACICIDARALFHLAVDLSSHPLLPVTSLAPFSPLALVFCRSANTARLLTSILSKRTALRSPAISTSSRSSTHSSSRRKSEQQRRRARRQRRRKLQRRAKLARTSH